MFKDSRVGAFNLTQFSASADLLLPPAVDLYPYWLQECHASRSEDKDIIFRLVAGIDENSTAPPPKECKEYDEFNR